MNETKGVTPQVGMGATVCLYSDSHAATIVKVTRTQVHVQLDHATRIDNNGMSDTQRYTYTPNPDAHVEIFRKTKHGYRSTTGARLRIGERVEFFDFSF